MSAISRLRTVFTFHTALRRSKPAGRPSIQLAPLATLLAELDRLAAGDGSRSAGAARVAAEIRRGQLAYWLGVMCATAVEGDSAFVVTDPVLLALARYEKATTGRDHTRLLPVPVRRRRLYFELLERPVPRSQGCLTRNKRQPLVATSTSTSKGKTLDWEQYKLAERAVFHCSPVCRSSGTGPAVLAVAGGTKVTPV